MSSTANVLLVGASTFSMTYKYSRDQRDTDRAQGFPADLSSFKLNALHGLSSGGQPTLNARR